MNTSPVAFVLVKGPTPRRGAGRLVMATRTQDTVGGSRRINVTFLVVVVVAAPLMIMVMVLAIMIKRKRAKQQEQRE